MSSPYSSMENAAQGAYSVVMDPHVATAVWAIVLALACALVMIIAEMVKRRNATAPAEAKPRSKTPPN